MAKNRLFLASVSWAGGRWAYLTSVFPLDLSIEVLRMLLKAHMILSRELRAKGGFQYVFIQSDFCLLKCCFLLSLLSDPHIVLFTFLAVL